MSNEMATSRTIGAMKPMDRATLVKAVAAGLLLGTTLACQQPARSAADAKDGGGAGSNEPLDRSGGADKSHCGGKGE